MRTVLTKGGLGVVLATGLMLAPALAHAQGRPPGISSDECKCQTATGKGQGKFVQSKQKCVTKCEQNARKGKEPAADCAPPYAGATASCVAKAETKAQQSETKGCAKDCPECYSGGNCSADARSRTDDTETQVDGFVPLIYCSPAPTDVDQQKCQDTQAGEAAKFAAAKATCYAECRDAECKGKAAPGSCTPPASDAKTAACISKAESKCAANVDEKCPAANVPACSAFTTGAALCGAIESAVDATDASTYCASPSGAFLDR